MSAYRPPYPVPGVIWASLPAPALLIDRYGLIAEVNPAGEIFLNASLKSLKGQPVLDRLIPLLNSDPNLRLVVEGHTDNVPIQTERFPSNWELSTGRAASVARYLIERGIAPQRLQATGYADTRPISDAQSPSEKALNRRVELTMEMATRRSRTKITAWRRTRGRNPNFGRI